MAPTKRKVFLGRFIYPKTREELAYLLDAAVCVDENGKIAAVEEGIDCWAAIQLKVLPSLGWSADEVEVQSCGDDDFFFPGFVGELPSHSHSPFYCAE